MNIKRPDRTEHLRNRTAGIVRSVDATQGVSVGTKAFALTQVESTVWGTWRIGGSCPTNGDSNKPRNMVVDLIALILSTANRRLDAGRPSST